MNGFKKRRERGHSAAEEEPGAAQGCWFRTMEGREMGCWAAFVDLEMGLVLRVQRSPRSPFLLVHVMEMVFRRKPLSISGVGMEPC